MLFMTWQSCQTKMRPNFSQGHCAGSHLEEHCLEPKSISGYKHLQHLLRHFPGVLAVKKKADQTKRLRITNITEYKYVPDASSMGSLPKKTHTEHCLPTRLGSTGSKDKRNNCNYEHSCTCIFTLQSDDYELHANKLCKYRYRKLAQHYQTNFPTE